MRVAIITRHAVANYGSLLQTIATQWAIEDLGHEARVIDYIRRDEEAWILERTLLSMKPRWNSSPMRRALYLALRTPEAVLAAKAFEKERKLLLNLTHRYSSLDELASNPPVADVYLSGSDQVWGPVAGGVYDDAYLLSFVPKGSVRVSYASSFGTHEMPAVVVDRFKHELSRYRELLLREDVGVNLVRSWGYCARQVLDPTLLIAADRWRSIASRPKNEEFVLVYQIHNNPEVDACARSVSKMLGLPLVRMSTSLHQSFRGGRMCWLPTIGGFIGNIDGARLLVTDSFHGTAFALNLGTPFIEVLPTNATSSRNLSLLRAVGMEGRVVHGPEDCARTLRSYDESNVREVLAGLREDSLVALRDAVEG